MSDNGPQYASREFSDFAKQYNFQHTTSSPHFPQSNGHAERAIQTVKKLLSGSTDPHMALLSLPFHSLNMAQAELLMGRPIHSNIPQPAETFIPQWPYLENVRLSNKKFKEKQKEGYGSRHGTRPLPTIPNNTPVWVSTLNNHGH